MQYVCNQTQIKVLSSFVIGFSHNFIEVRTFEKHPKSNKKHLGELNYFNETEFSTIRNTI